MLQLSTLTMFNFCYKAELIIYTKAASLKISILSGARAIKHRNYASHSYLVNLFSIYNHI